MEAITIAMESALVLLNCQSGCEQIVMQAIRRMPEVVEANFVFGGYDIVAKVAAETMERLKAVVSWKIRKLDGVKTGLTLIRQENQVRT
jgi:DNA-binding Lrp family transcriptional regulator